MPRAIGIGIGTAFGGHTFTPSDLDPVLWLDASTPGTSAQTWKNYGTGGTALDAQAGSSSGADSNDPLYLDWTGTNYLYLPGTSGNYASAGEFNAMPVADFECIVGVVPDGGWGRTTFGAFCGNTNQASTGFRFFTGNTVPRLVLSWFDSGTSTFRNVGANADSSAGTDFRYVRVTLDIDNGAGGCDTAFFFGTSPTGPWTQVGTTVTTATVATPAYSALAGENFGIGSQRGNGFQNGCGGAYQRVIIRSGGSTIFDADFTTGLTTGATTSFTASTSQTVTINRSTSGRKAVAVAQRPVWLLGTDDYFEIADNNALLDFGAADSATWVIVHRQWNNFGTNDALLAKKADTTAATQGWLVGSGSTAAQVRGQVGDGSDSAEPVTGSRTAGTRALAAVVLDRGAATATSYLNTTAGSAVSTTNVGDLSNAEVMRIGRLSGAGTEYSDVEIDAVLLFRRALTAAEIGQLVTYYGAA